MAILPRVCAGMTTGGLAVLLAQPTDVVKVRFQAQQSAKAAPKYLSTLQAYRTIAREEGAAGLWKGQYSIIRHPRLLYCGKLAAFSSAPSIIRLCNTGNR